MRLALPFGGILRHSPSGLSTFGSSTRDPGARSDVLADPQLDLQRGVVVAYEGDDDPGPGGPAA